MNRRISESEVGFVSRTQPATLCQPLWDAMVGLSGKTQLASEVVALAESLEEKDDESLEDSWSRLQASATAQRLDVSYAQERRAPDAVTLEKATAVATQDARLAAQGCGVEDLCGAIGRRVVARRAFAAGERVMACAAYSSALLPRHAGARCANCFVALEES